MLSRHILAPLLSQLLPCYASWIENTSEGELFQDINPDSGSSFPHASFGVKNGFYFVADDGVNGEELWFSNGIASQQVADIAEGPLSSFPFIYGEVGGWLYFRARNGIHGTELWRTSGAKTELVSDWEPGPESSDPGRFWLGIDETHFLYVAGSDAWGTELLATDGNVTQVVADLRILNESSYPRIIYDIGESMTIFTASGNRSDVYEVYIMRNGVTEPQVFIDFGTFYDGYDDVERLSISGFSPIRGDTFLMGVDIGGEHSVWRVSRSGELDKILDNFDVKTGFRLFEDKWVTIADHLEAGTELYVTDGTTEGTQLIQEFRNGVEDGFSRSFLLSPTPSGVPIVQNSKNGTSDEREYVLYSSDGTQDGTVLLADVGLDLGEPAVDVTGYVIFLDGRFAVSFEGNSTGIIYVSDGTPDGTYPVVKQSYATRESTFGWHQIAALHERQGVLYFRGYTEEVGFELFTVDLAQRLTQEPRRMPSDSPVELTDPLEEPIESVEPTEDRVDPAAPTIEDTVETVDPGQTSVDGGVQDDNVVDTDSDSTDRTSLSSGTITLKSCLFV